MEIVFKMLKDGGFVAGDRKSGMTAYAYPSSPNADRAKKHPKAVAEEMMGNEKKEYRELLSVRGYDRKNWMILNES